MNQEALQQPGRRIYRCVICQREVEYSPPELPPLYPFCSRRCKLVDLGRWLREQYTIDRDLRPEDLAKGPDTQE